jgi:hypothetical protein
MLPVYREAIRKTRDAPKSGLSAGAPACAGVWDNNVTLGLAAAGAALPGVPVAKRLHLLVEAGFFDEHIKFAA